MELLKRDDPRRKRRAFERHAILLLRTLSAAAITTFFWYVVWTCGYHFPEDDKDIIIGAIITSLGVTYGVLIAWLLGAILEKYKKVVIAVLEKDEHTFLLYRDERMPIVSHLLIAAVSVPLIGMIGAIAYKHALTGGISVFAVSCILTLFWLVAIQLEDPAKGAWFRERIPPHWMTRDIDVYFGLGPNRHATHDDPHNLVDQTG